MNLSATWPADADGDVFRRLEARDFDFAAAYEIDFNVDFEDWPPHPKALAWLKSTYSEITVYEPQEEFGGYVQFKLRSKLTYTLVIDTQAEATAGVEHYGGACESWGVIQLAP